MSTQNKELVVGDVVKWEQPHEICRVEKNVSRDLSATVGLVVGECMEPDTAVAQIHTVTTSDNPDGGTYKLGYKGQWTTALAWNASAATMKTAFELLSLVTDTITFSNAIDDAITMTWTTAGQKAEIDWDGRLLLDGAVVMDEDSVSIDVTTIGSTAAEMVIIATGTNCSGILLEKVTLADLLAGNDLSRPFLVKGDCIVDGDNLFALAAQLATSKTALVALGITIRTEPTIYQSGPPTS